MALSDDLRERVVAAVVEAGLSRNAAAKRFGVSIASAVRWVARFQTTGGISPAPTGGDRRCAEHVRKLGGASPLPSRMTAKG